MHIVGTVFMQWCCDWRMYLLSQAIMVVITQGEDTADAVHMSTFPPTPSGLPFLVLVSL